MTSHRTFILELIAFSPCFPYGFVIGVCCPSSMPWKKHVWFFQLCWLKTLLILQSPSGHRPLLVLQPGVDLLSTPRTTFSTIFSDQVPPLGRQELFFDTSTHPSTLRKLSPKPAFKVFLSWFSPSSLNFHAELELSTLPLYISCSDLELSDSFPKCLLIFLALAENLYIFPWCYCTDKRINNFQFPETFTLVTITALQATISQLPLGRI